jgi:octaprenyl-diphosphate synthase
MIKNESDRPEKVREIIAFVKNKGGLEYAEIKMKDFASRALEILEVLPASTAKSRLADLVAFTINRKN